MPKISVIVPVYNTEKYLKKCLDSITNQTFQDIEIIIVNDGSTDNSETIIKEYQHKYHDKIKYFKKENGGLSDARNFGVNQAKGEYLNFVDSDDYLDINLFSNLQEQINENIDLIKYKLIKVDENYKELERIDGPVFNSLSGQDAFNKLVFQDVLLEPACLYLFRTEFYKNNNFNFMKDTYHEDFGLIPLIILKSNTCVSTNIYGYNYVQTGNSIVRDKDYSKTLRRANDLLIHYDYMLETVEVYNINEKTKDNIKLYYTNAILNAVKHLKKTDQREYSYEIKIRKLLKNIKVTNIKQLLKKIILKMSIKIYLKCV